MAADDTVLIPALGDILRQGLRQLAENVLAPTAVFYTVLVAADQRGAFIAAMAWCLAAIAVRVLLRRPVPAILALGTVLLLARTVVGLSTGSAFLYFLQPSLSNFVLAAMFVASVPGRQPLIARLAGDFCALPADLIGSPRLRRFFVRVSLLWALVFCANGAVTIWALVSIPLREFLVVSTSVSAGAVILTAALSLLWFRRCLRQAGMRLRLSADAAF